MDYYKNNIDSKTLILKCYNDEVNHVFFRKLLDMQFQITLISAVYLFVSIYVFTNKGEFNRMIIIFIWALHDIIEGGWQCSPYKGGLRVLASPSVSPMRAPVFPLCSISVPLHSWQDFNGVNAYKLDFDKCDSSGTLSYIP